MKVGLFICDHVEDKLQSEFGDYPDMFARLFPEFNFVLYDVCKGHFPEDVKECEIYMCTGSFRSVYDDIDWITQLKSVIREIYEQKIFFIGCCFGHQLIGEALGGKVQKAPTGWCVGIHQFEIQKQKEWMPLGASSFNILMLCQDQILELPPHSQVLASNALCPVGVIQVGETMLGFQGHPEFSKGYDTILMQNRSIGADIVKKGLASLELEIDTTVFRDWIFGFLKK